MRTTLDIDDDVLQAAKELAKWERKTTGQVVSDFIRRGLTHSAGAFGPGKVEIIDGIPVLPSRGGVVTKDLVDRLIVNADLEDAGLSPGD